MPARFVVRAGALTVASFWARGSRWSTDAGRPSAWPGRRRASPDPSSPSSAGGLVLRRVVPQRVEQGVGHVGLKAERSGRSVSSSSCTIRFQLWHTPPTDLALGGKPLAKIGGDVARLAERWRRVFGPLRSLSQSARAAGRIDPHDSVRTRAELAQRLAMRQPLRTCSRNCFRSGSLPIAEPPPVGGQTGATSEPITSLRERTFSARRLRSSSVESISTCVRTRTIDAVELRAVHLGRRVRSSIVSRLMGGSESGPFPRRPARPHYAISGNCCVRSCSLFVRSLRAWETTAEPSAWVT